MTDADFLLHLLRIAAEDDDLNPDHLGFAVITGGRRDVPGTGPMAGQIVTLDEVSFRPFSQGEILVLAGDECGREPFGEGRKPAKWDVACEWFGHDYAAAKRRSNEVKSAPARDAFAPPETVR
jgi:hypothetical protein